MSRPTVVLVDDHALFRAGVRAELESRDGAPQIVGEAGDVDEAVRMVLALEPDVVLLDVHMPGGGGAEVLRRVHEKRPGQKVLALSVSDEPEDVIALIRGGARGYVTKTISGDELVAAVGRVRDGDAVFSPRLAGFVLDAFAGRLEAGAALVADPELDGLTDREREVLRLIARGYLYKEIARRLSISPKTVEHHVSAVLRKLQLSNRHELTRWATERRLVD
ncbi:response regulator transcription factor [Patulibacter sp. SYSU D01012]|uniref:response regulator n=1 Tax=Patulibacter sp. SYSU D01012 TaxID=2817381 RepID=UPI001B304F3B